MTTPEELELLMSPSRWCKRYPAEEVCQKHIEYVTEVCDITKNNVPCQLGVPYGSSDQEKLDIFGTNLPDDSPIFIYIHGGYWQMLSRELSSYVVKPLNNHNFKVIVVGYTLCPQVTLSHIIEQIQKAMLKSVQYARTKGSRGIYLGGHSAGAHLVISMFQTFFSSLPVEDQNLLKGIFLISGVYDLTVLTQTYINDALKLDSTSARRFSPLYQNLCAPKHIQFYVIVGENDSPAFKEQSKLLHKKLESSDNVSRFIEVKEVDHFNIVEKLNEEEYEIVRLIISQTAEDKKFEIN